MKTRTWTLAKFLDSRRAAITLKLQSSEHRKSREHRENGQNSPFSLLPLFLSLSLTELGVGGSFLPPTSSHRHVTHVSMVAIHSCDKCHMPMAFGWLLSHHTLSVLLWCHVAQPHGAMWHHAKCQVSPDISCLEKHEIPTVSKSDEIRLGSYISQDDSNGKVCFIIQDL